LNFFHENQVERLSFQDHMVFAELRSCDKV